MLHNCRMQIKLPREKHPVFIMKMVSDRAESLFMQRVGTLRVTAPQCRVLMYLESRNGAPVSQRLEEKGYVRTAFDDADGRVKHAYLTAEFRRRQAEAQQAMQEFEEQLVAGFSPAEVEQLRQLLERIYQNTLTPGA